VSRGHQHGGGENSDQETHASISQTVTVIASLWRLGPRFSSGASHAGDFHRDPSPFVVGDFVLFSRLD
jgi:hypothetical protein